jgi:hypothetical protein
MTVAGTRSFARSQTLLPFPGVLERTEVPAYVSADAHREAFWSVLLPFVAESDVLLLSLAIAPFAALRYNDGASIACDALHPGGESPMHVRRRPSCS